MRRIRVTYNAARTIALAARSKACVCSRSLVGIAGSNPAGDIDVCLSAVTVVCFQVELSATSWSLIQRNPIECGVSECDREWQWSSTMKRPWPSRDCHAIKNKTMQHVLLLRHVDNTIPVLQSAASAVRCAGQILPSRVLTMVQAWELLIVPKEVNYCNMYAFRQKF